MGCDGGTIPRRNELVKVKQKPELKDQTSHLNFQWRYCNITQQVLQRPIVTCGLGKLYNKTSIIEAIINREQPGHVRSLKDVLELGLTPNREFSPNENTPSETAPYICPVTGLEMSGKFKFVALWSCGCVFAERALREVKMEVCPRCQRSFSGGDVVVLNPSTRTEVDLMIERMKTRKKLKKNKK